MKVILRSNIKLDKDSVELRNPANVRDLLLKLSSEFSFLHPDKIFEHRWAVVSLNQREINLLPQGINTLLSENDQIEIAIASFSGG